MVVAGCGKTNQANAARAGSTAIARPGASPSWRASTPLTNESRSRKRSKPIVDGTFELLEESEEIFDRLKGYFGGGTCGWKSAATAIHRGWGASWVTNRVPKLLKIELDRRPGAAVVVDFYYAVEHVKAAAETQKKWTETQRKAWIKKQKKQVVSRQSGQSDRRYGATERKKSKTETAYFVTRKEQMQYSAFKKAGWPIGSGAVESASMDAS